MSTLATNAITDASGGNTATINSYTPTESNMAGRNKIINGSMVFDQRNAGASVSCDANVYGLDRWQYVVSQASKLTVQQNAGSVTPPVGFSNYMGFTSTSAYSVGTTEYFYFQQSIEGNNIADLAWGTASAASVTLSFWVYSSLTGTFGGALQNGAQNRSYPFSYTISAANTWEQKTVTIAGDTTGTWLTTNGVGVSVYFGLGIGLTAILGTAGAWAAADHRSVTGAVSVVGTSGATFYITGVQLEAGSVATPFEHRMYGQELALCLRYFWMIFNGGSNDGRPLTMLVIMQANASSGLAPVSIQHIVPMRAAPSVTFTNSADSYLNWPATGSVPINSSGHSIWGTNNQKHTAYLISYGSGSAAFVAGSSMVFDVQGSTVFSLSAEL
jgi:hypothetical protein